MSSANWALGFPYTPSGNYGNAANWDTHAVPNELAGFGQSYMSVVSITTPTTAGGWFIGNAQPYTFIVSNPLTFNGQGVVGGSGGSQLYNSDLLSFVNGASAGLLIYHNSGVMSFANSSSAGNALIDNPGYLYFTNSSTAGYATIAVGKSGIVQFTDRATAGAANLVTAAEGSQIGRVVFAGDGPAHNHKLTAGSFSGSGVFDLRANEVTVGGSNANTTVSGQITGGSSGRLVKAGDGTMTLNGSNSYGGGTAVNDGELIVNGLIGKVTVGGGDNFGVLLGNGSVGATTVKYGRLSAGPDLDEAGRLHTGNLDLQRGGRLVVDIAGIASPGAPNGYDQLKVTGTVKLAGVLSTNTIKSPGAVPRHTLTIINNDGKDKVSGTFSNGTLYGGLKEGDAFASGESAIYSISYKGGTGNDVVLRSEGHFSFGTGGNDTINANTAPGGNELNKTTKLADYIVAYDGNDTIASGAGNDTIYGGRGRDLIDGGAGEDYASYFNAGTGGVQVTLNGAKLATVKIGGHADDRIKNVENVGGSYENDKLTGDSKDNVLLGDDGKDTLKGGGGNDALVGGRGKDMLEGGGGKDEFVFDKVPEAANADTIKDFHHRQDNILLDIAEFAAIGSKLDSAEFYAKAGASKAHDANDHIIYNTSNGKLYYDDDGKGGHAAVLFATLSGHPGLSAADFVAFAGHLDIA